MMIAVLDTNVVVQATISNRGASYRVVEALLAGRFRAAFSTDSIAEHLQVLQLPAMRARHQMSDREIERYLVALTMEGLIVSPSASISASLPRDVSDVKLLSLAVSCRANYLVSNDRRDIRRLKLVGETRIVSPAAFLKHLDEET